MVKDSTIWLHSIGVMITAKWYNPSTLNRDFLVNEGIVPKDWLAKEFVTT